MHLRAVESTCHHLFLEIALKWKLNASDAFKEEFVQIFNKNYIFQTILWDSVTDHFHNKPVHNRWVHNRLCSYQATFITDLFKTDRLHNRSRSFIQSTFENNPCPYRYDSPFRTDHVAIAPSCRCMAPPQWKSAICFMLIVSSKKMPLRKTTNMRRSNAEKCSCDSRKISVFIVNFCKGPLSTSFTDHCYVCDCLWLFAVL